jgi:GNAT superfamily N-acetyltransferase
MSRDVQVRAGVSRLGPPDAGELLTLQLAAWVREGREAGTIEIPPLLEELPDVQAQLADPSQTIWGYREGPRLIATVRTFPLPNGSAYLGRLGVVPDRFRQGLGSVMLRLAEDRLPPGITRIELVTGIRSFGNHAFYARHGYEIYERDEAVGVVRLAKRLG